MFDSNIAAKERGEKTTNTLIFCEHEPTYTLGKSGDEANMLFKPEVIGAAFFKIQRGGDITYHGPGQLVIYPVFDLDTFGLGVAEFVHLIEQVVINTISHYGLVGTRIDGAAGIWLNADTYPVKICAVGMRMSRKCSMHGIAINVNTNLKYFDYIVPCGLSDKGVTSLQMELGREVDLNEVQDVFIKQMKVVGFQFEE